MYSEITKFAVKSKLSWLVVKCQAGEGYALGNSYLDRQWAGQRMASKFQFGRSDVDGVSGRVFGASFLKRDPEGQSKAGHGWEGSLK